MESIIINLSNALGWSIVHSIWQAAIWFILYSLYILVNPQISAKAKHNAAFGTQLSIFISFIISLIYFYQSNQQVVNIQSFSPEEIKNLLADMKNHGFRFESLLPYVVVGYLFGFIVQILLLSNSLIKLRTLKYKGLDSIPKNWTSIYYNAKQKLGLSKSVGIYLSNKISVPITLGHIKPFILFPIAYANKMDLAQVETILLHELAHVKRQDYLFNLIKVFIETLMFFNPFIWAISKVLEREREHACDDMVLEHISTPLSYAQALVELEELRMSLNPALTLAATGNKNHLFNRIKRITKMEKKYKNVRPQLLAVLLSGLALLALAVIMPIQQSNAQEKKHTRNSQNDYKITIVDTIKPMPPEPARQPEAPINAHQTITYKGKVYTDTAELPLDVRNRLRSITEHTKKLQEQFNSQEWNDHIAKLTKDANNMEKHMNSPEFKAKMKQIEENSKKVTAYFESDEWKKQMTNIEKEAGKAAEYFNSKAWQDQVKKIEMDSKNIAAHFESAEWKNQMANIEKNAIGMAEKFNSPEWKARIQKIEEDGKNIHQYFESPEWKKKIKNWEELKDTPGYKELNDKYQKDLEALKKKKSISNK